MHTGDGDSVIGHGDPGSLGAFQPELHFLFVQHAAAAVDDQPERGKIFRETGSAGKLKLQVFPGIILDPARQFDGPDIFALPMMGAALADQDSIAVLQLF